MRHFKIMQAFIVGLKTGQWPLGHGRYPGESIILEVIDKFDQPTVTAIRCMRAIDSGKKRGRKAYSFYTITDVGRRLVSALLQIFPAEPPQRPEAVHEEIVERKAPSRMVKMTS